MPVYQFTIVSGAQHDVRGHVQLFLKDGSLVSIHAWTSDAAGIVEFDVTGELAGYD